MPKRGDYVYRRKDGLWEARYVKEITADGKRKFGSVYAHSCSEAKEKRQAMVEYYLFNPPPIGSANSLTMRELAEEWLFVNRVRIKPSTHQKYRGFCNNHIFPTLGEQKVTRISTAQIQAFAIDRLNGGLAPQSVNSLLPSPLKMLNRLPKASGWKMSTVVIMHLAT